MESINKPTMGNNKMNDNLEDKICMWFDISRSQRATESAQGLSKEGIKAYTDMGCYMCDGFDTDCGTYEGIPFILSKGVLEKEIRKSVYLNKTHPDDEILRDSLNGLQMMYKEVFGVFYHPSLAIPIQDQQLTFDWYKKGG